MGYTKKKSQHKIIWKLASLLGQVSLGYCHRRHRTNKKKYPKNASKSNKLYLLKLKESKKEDYEF